MIECQLKREVVLKEDRDGKIIDFGFWVYNQ